MQTLVELKNICAGYGKKRVLENVSLNIYENDFLGIIGPNGGGKTTLVRVLLGLITPEKGTVSFFRNAKPVKELSIGYLPQYTMIDKKFPISVREVVLSGLAKQRKLFKKFTTAQRQQAENMLEEMGLTNLAELPIETLSGGQLQRVLLARAVVSMPELLILDEPNTYIDKRYQEQMYQMLETIAKRCAIVMVSHDMGSILQNVKNIACVNHTLHYHSGTDITEEELYEPFGCPIELVTHGELPHRVLKNHQHNTRDHHSKT